MESNALIQSIEEFDETTVDSHDTLIHRFWSPNPQITNYLVESCTANHYTTILDVGAGSSPFPRATHLIDAVAGPSVYQVDIDYEPIPFPIRHFQFVYCRHTIEDIQNPLHAVQEIFRVSQNGYIETPSPLVELMKGVDGGNTEYHGYCHHRYIVWSDSKTNTLHCLPKYPLVEYVQYTPQFLKKQLAILNNFPVYWNNYYKWDKDHPPSIHVYRHGINMNINSEYIALLNRAIHDSIDYTNHFVRTSVQ